MSKHFNTVAIHAGQPLEPNTGSVNFPIFQTSTFGQIQPGVHKGYCYSRTGNPTRTALEENLAELEGGRFCVAFSSGLAAAAAAISLLKQGDHVIACQDIYGGSYRSFTKIYQRFGIEFTFVDTTDLKKIGKAVQENTKFLWLETPSNPLLRVSDISGAVSIAKEHDLFTVVDNTFATPFLQNPLSLGADIVLHSTTKYLNGHADVIGGALVVNDEDIADNLRFIQNTTGGVPGPQDCFLTLRGIKTLGIRMERHCENAFRVARYLENHDKVRRVHYPGLESHPGFAIASRQQKLYGGMVSFELASGYESAKEFTTNTSLFTLAESLGSVQSLCNHPASMTHASVEPEVRRANGLEDGLIRLSVGLEDCDDLIKDLETALSSVNR